jgi:hypothetical protein
VVDTLQCFSRINFIGILYIRAKKSIIGNYFTKEKEHVNSAETLANPVLQKQNAKNLKQIFPEKEYRSLSPNFHIHVSVSELYIPTMGLPVLLEEICRLILGIYKSLKDT